MDRRPLLLIALALGMGGCVNAPPPKDDVERISFQPQPPPFCGRCETTTFTVTADGLVRIERGHWAGRYRDWRREHSVKRVTPEQFAAFKRRLAPYKPSTDTVDSEAGCRNYIHDNDGAVIEWSGDGERRSRSFDFGCLDDRAMNEAVRRAPETLGL